MEAGTRLTVNGTGRTLAAAPDTMLLDVLRGELGLKAARFGCGEGLCGSCRVLVDGHAVASCNTPLWSVAGRAITTPEGLGTAEAPHPVQAALIAEQAAQCGYCISGIVVSAAALLAQTPDPDDAAIRAALDPNLCRCGAHNRILRAVRRAAVAMRDRAA
jgi:nicotinate dehydrogenase subunit A